MANTVKTTLDIRDELLERAKQLAKREGQPLRSVVEEGLRLVLIASEEKSAYVLEDFSVGDPDALDPLESLTWQDLRQEIYGEPVSK
jgi:hypothetical protein